MNTLPKISIIIPIYNVEEYIIECLQSVMRQTYKGEIECILVDDCGKDNSISIAEQLIADYTGPIAFRILHHEHNRGLSAARNTGMDVISGEYILFIDSDDFILPSTLEKLYETFLANPQAGIVAVLPYKYPEGTTNGLNIERWTHKYNTIKRIKSEDFCISLLKQDVCHTAWGKLFRSDLVKSCRFLEGRNNEDTRFYFDLTSEIRKRGCEFIELPDKLYAYRVNPNGICSNLDRLKFDILLNLIDIRNLTDDLRVYSYVNQEVFNMEFAYFNNSWHQLLLFDKQIVKDYRNHYSYAFILNQSNTIKQKMKMIFYRRYHIVKCIQKIRRR